MNGRVPGSPSAPRGLGVRIWVEQEADVEHEHEYEQQIDGLFRGD